MTLDTDNALQMPFYQLKIKGKGVIKDSLVIYDILRKSLVALENVKMKKCY